METSFDSALRLNKWAKHNDFKPSSFLLVSATYLCDHLEPDTQSMWGNFHPHSKLTFVWIPVELTPFQTQFICDWITNLVSCDLPEETKKKDGRNVTLTLTCILQPQKSAESYADFYWIEMNVIHKVLYISYLLCVLLLHILRCWLCFHLAIIV